MWSGAPSARGGRGCTTYELKKRAERLADTRRRITEATVELHRTVGPAATHINEAARRAGVQRMTVYDHFPNEQALLTACSAHWRALHPTPDRIAWRAVQDPGTRLRLGLGELYGWYRETDPMTANVLRDAQVLPALRAAIDLHTWRALAPLGDTEVADLTAGLVELAASTDLRRWR